LDGNILQIFKGSTAIVTSVAFTPDGRNALTVSGQKARLWNLPGYYKFIEKPSTRILSIAFSPDSKKVIKGLSDATAVLCDLKGNIIHVFKGHTSSVSAVAFSPDGQNILTGSYDRTVYLWDLQGNIKHVFKGHTNNIYSIAFSPNGQRILTGARDSTLRLWDLKGDIISVFRNLPRGSDITFSPDGQQILVGLLFETRLLDIKGNTIKVFQSRGVAFSPDGKKILTGAGLEAQLQDKDGKVLTVFKGHTDYIQAVAFSPDGQKVITGSRDQTIRLWDLDGNLIQTFKTNSGTVTVPSIAFSPDGQFILAKSSNDQLANLWRIKVPYPVFYKEGSYEQLSVSQKFDYGILTFEEIYELNDVDKLIEAAEWFYKRLDILNSDKKNEFLNNIRKLVEKAVSIIKESINIINQKRDIKLEYFFTKIDQYFKIFLLDGDRKHFTEIDTVFIRINELEKLDYKQLLIDLSVLRQKSASIGYLRMYLAPKIIKYYEEQSRYQDFDNEEIIVINVINSYGGMSNECLNKGQLTSALEYAQKGYKIKPLYTIASDYCKALLYNDRIDDIEPIVTKQKENSDTFQGFKIKVLNELNSLERGGHKAKYSDRFREIINK
jgi:tetratricopeptide (TPR) repeat protein